MYAVTLRAQTKDGRMDELKEFIKSKALPSLEVPGIISIGFLNPELNTNLGMAFLTNKESAEVFAEERTRNIMQVADVFASFPKVVRDANIIP